MFMNIETGSADPLGDFTVGINEIKTIGVVGLGLIGGSLAKSLSRAGYVVAGYDRDPAVIDRALSDGVIRTGGISEQAVLGADLFFIALYPDACRHFIEANAEKFNPQSIVVDCCGVKGSIYGPAAKLAAEHGFLFIGGHPMAGTEKNGYDAATPDLFCGASFILTPPPGTPDSALQALKSLLPAAGFKKVVVTTPEHHDRMIAFTSQLPHVLACAYVKSPSCPMHAGYSAGSYRDVSRVAHINAPLWAELFIENKDALLAEIDGLASELNMLRSAIEAGDSEKLSALLGESGRIKDTVG